MKMVDQLKMEDKQKQANITSFFAGGSRKRSSSSEPKTSDKKISKIVRNLVVPKFYSKNKTQVNIENKRNKTSWCRG